MVTTHRLALAALATASIALSACGADSASYEYGGADYNVAPPEDYQSGETYDEVVENDFVSAADEDTSTFSIDVDNASYTIMRRDLENGRLPAPESVRPEEYINYFDYAYAPPQEDPFSINLEGAPSRFGEDLHVLKVGLQGIEVPNDKMKPTSLVFLIDTSGSMSGERKLPMVKKSLHTLVENLRPNDSVGIVVYAGDAGTVLEPTPVSQKQKICDAIDRLGAGGGTAGEAGIVEAYKLAERSKKPGGNNRVVILTDGDFNIGRTGEELFTLIDSYRDQGVSLTAVGYGLGNYNDYTMENIAKRGNGNYFYVDSLDEAARVFGTELSSTLEVIAADVKIQLEFNADAVARYRLIGYENRLLDNEDFDDDAVDAGELGPGHTVTALYEIELSDQASDAAALVDVRLRYKSQYGTESKLLERGIKVSELRASFDAASDGLRLAAAVAEYAEILRGSKHSEGDRFDDVLDILDGVGALPEADRRAELSGLVTKARDLK
jgi:Ca-activated chloride channel family protein